MNQATVQKLHELTHAFYAHYAESFGASRQAPWQGWKALVPSLLVQSKNAGEVLDIGCGNGRFAVFLDQLSTPAPFAPDYLGIDSSTSLLLQAKKQSYQHINPQFMQLDILDSLITSQDLPQELHRAFAVVAAFGLMHHIPSQNLRKALLSSLRAHATHTTLVILSFWQFGKHLSERTPLAKLEDHGIDPGELEPGDTLLGWKGITTYPRYCHSFTNQEALDLAQQTGWEVHQSFTADGKNSDANLYLVLTPQQG